MEMVEMVDINAQTAFQRWEIGGNTVYFQFHQKHLPLFPCKRTPSS